MAPTSRELTYQTLDFADPCRAPQMVWILPWATNRYQAEIDAILADFPPDIGGTLPYLFEPAKTVGDPYAIGRYVDEWGCVFENAQEGIIGEVRDPIIKNWDTDTERVHIPREWLTVDKDHVNRDCAESDQFLLAGVCPRPFERLQFLRGTADLYVELLMQPKGLMNFMAEMHAFYCEVLELWASTDVDALMFMDDWGSQQSLLIDPALWRDLFKPMYRDFIQIAHGAGKKAFMHSDGYIVDIFPDLIELGLDAINSQIFCMGIDTVAPYAGQITFWGEVDRQHILRVGTLDEVEAAVREIHEKLWKKGGCVAMCEIGAGTKPANVYHALKTWQSLGRKA